MAEIISLTKFDAARRQLRTAIELWFNDGDPVSIYALVYAAHEIIHRLYRLKGLSDLLYDTSVFPKNIRAIANKAIKDVPNWIKHAEHEEEMDEIKTFNPWICDLLLMVCVVGIVRMDYELTEFESAITLWHFFHDRDWFPPEMTINSIPSDRLEKMRHLSRNAFLPAFLEAWEQGLIR